VRGHEVLESSLEAGSTGIYRDQAGKSAVFGGFHRGLLKFGGADAVSRVGTDLDR
jgi:hypothetical protein